MFTNTGRTHRVSDAIARRIKKQISDGRLTAGHKLPAERDMARQFKTSRVSVREAYRSLEELGAAAHPPRRGRRRVHRQVRSRAGAPLALARVRPRQDLAQRGHRGAHAARADDRAAGRAARAPRGHHQAGAGPAPGGGRGPRAAADSGTTAGQFHRAIADCARNVPLVVLMNALADLTAESVSVLDAKVRSKHRRKNCEYHREIFEAISAHDGRRGLQPDAAARRRHPGPRRPHHEAGRGATGMCGPAAAPKQAARRR